MQRLITLLAQQVAGVEVAFTPGLLGGPGELQIVGAWAETHSHGLVLLGTFVMAELDANQRVTG